MNKRDLDPDLLAKRIKNSNPSMSSESARQIAVESARRVEREQREQKKGK